MAPPVRNEDDNLVGFGINADKTCERFPSDDPPEEVSEGGTLCSGKLDCCTYKYPHYWSKVSGG